VTHPPSGIKDFLNRETRPLAGSLYFKKSSISTLDIRHYAPVTLMQHPNRRSRPQHVTTMIHTYLLLRLPYRYARLLCDVVHSLGQQPLSPKGFFVAAKRRAHVGKGPTKNMGFVVLINALVLLWALGELVQMELNHSGARLLVPAGRCAK
jgi:hypothetical protein